MLESLLFQTCIYLPNCFFLTKRSTIIRRYRTPNYSKNITSTATHEIRTSYPSSAPPILSSPDPSHRNGTRCPCTSRREVLG